MRNGSYYLTYVFYKTGWKAPQVLLLHFAFDLCALVMVALYEPLYALLYWLLAHVADNCDGALARARDETDMKYLAIDVHLHLWANMIFWVIVYAHTGSALAVALLAARVVMESFRSQTTNETRYGQKSRMWAIITKPTDMNVMYLLYVPFALAHQLEWYVAGYAIYYALAAVGQSAVWLRRTW